MVRFGLAVCVLACSLLVSPAFAEPEVFSKAGYEADREAAVEGGKLHIVFVSSDVCNASQVLERRRWTEPEIIEWMTANAVVSRLGLETAETQIRELGVLATPTTIVYRNDSEIGRASGAWWEEDLLMWLEHLRSGAPIDPVVADRMAVDKSGTPMLEWFYAGLAGADRLYLEGPVPFLLGQDELLPLLERLDAARQAGDAETEVALSLWLIRNGNSVYSVSPDPVSIAVFNLSQGLHEGRLGDEAVRSLADALEAEALGFALLAPIEFVPGVEAEYEPLRTWVSLNEALRNWDKLVEWTAERLEVDAQEIQRSGFGWVCEEAAVRTKRWDVLAGLIPDPVARAQETLEIPMAAMGFDVIMGADADELDAMRDAVAWGVYHPAIAAMIADDEGATEARFVSVMEEGMGSAHMWRVVVILGASSVELLNQGHIDWIGAHDLGARYPQFAEDLGSIEAAWLTR